MLECPPIDQLIIFMQRVADGFQRSESTYAIFIDLKLAYDEVLRPGLFDMSRWSAGTEILLDPRLLTRTHYKN